ncbi:MAG: FAD-dependent oxidoreductase [bacterium]|nr:MAG: FAD-dependent oxidoreductase [bacterium]
MKGSVLVIGAGPAGMRAAAELVQQGFKVFLVEEKPTIGGKMAQIDKMYPSDECSTCTILPRMLELTSNPDNITIMAFSEVTGIDGSAGDFTVKVTKKSRYVDTAKCNACTDCFPVCPVGLVPMEFNYGRSVSKAISFYAPFPPRKAIIYPEKCDYLLKGKCGDEDQPPCVKACEAEAIDFNQKPQKVELHVGAVILATGRMEDTKDATEKCGYGRYPNILTALEYERLLSGLGPTGGVVKRDDGKEPQSVAWMVIDSSSSVSFLSAVSEALGTLEKNPEATVSILYENINLQRESYNEFYQAAKDKHINFIQTDYISVTEGEEGNIAITYSQGGKSDNLLNVEMFVLATPLVPGSSTYELADRIGIEMDEAGFFRKKSGEIHPLLTLRDGIFVCGSIQESKGIDDAVVQSCAAAANAAAHLAQERHQETKSPPERELLAVEPEDEPSVAVVVCRCGLNIAGLLDLDELVQYTESLPHVKSVEVTPFGCDGVKIKELLKSKKYNRLVLGACSPRTHESLFQIRAETGGLNRYLVEIVNLRNHCTWVHSKDKTGATSKAKKLMKMGVNRAALLEPLDDIKVPVTSSALVVGGTPSGIACSLKLAQMGFQVHLAESKSSLSNIKNNDSPYVKSLIDELEKYEKVTIHTETKIAGVEGFVGNYKASLVNSNGNVDIGSVVIATNADMKSDAAEGDYEKDLLLSRDDQNLFIGMLGILNPQDFNTEGVFRCGSARSEMGMLEAIIDGEGAASRVAGVISKDELTKSPMVSVVVDENCDGCAYCIEPCPAQALTLIEYILHDGTIKKTVDNNDAICRGCGICMATCPKVGIYVKNFKTDHFNTMIQSLGEVE